MKDEQLYNYFNNAADVEDIRELEEWLKEDSSHQKDFDDAHTVYNAMAFQEHNYVPEKSVRKKFVLPKIWKAAGGIAAAAVLFAGVGLAGKYAGEKRYEDYLASQLNIVEVPAGQNMSITLNDGTRVFLNGGSKLEYPPLFTGDKRNVRLSGEAFLQVEHDENHPFIVSTFASEIEVLGTEFNVFADEANGHFSTTLLNGKVKVSTFDGRDAEQVVLNPDEMVRKVDGHLVVSKVAADEIISWIDGYINIGGVGFEELMHRFEDAFDVRIILERKDIEGYMGGKIKVSDGVDFALHLLMRSCDFTYERTDDGKIVIK